MLYSDEVPQADLLSDVISTVRFVNDNPGADDDMIGSHMGKGDRQGRYYRHAAELLGLIRNSSNSAYILEDGISYLNLSTSQEKNEFLKMRVMGLDVFKLTVDYINNNPGCTPTDVYQLLDGEGINDSTADRRTKTIISWLIHLDVVRQTGNSLYLN